MYLLYILSGFVLLVGAAYLIKSAEVRKGRKLADEEYARTHVERFAATDALEHITLIPLVDSRSADPALKTENGVSYLIETDKANVLLDLGFNRKGEHPSPLLHNMQKLGKSFDNIDAIIISHAHLDHLGGLKEQRSHQFSISQGAVKTPAIPVYAPARLAPSAFNPQLSDIRLSAEPTEIAPGIYTIGVIPRHLFLMGRVEEQALALRLAGKGIVLVIGCGHQKIQRIIERTHALFRDPIYAVIGGLHLPVNGRTAFERIQYVVGDDHPPHRGLSQKDVHAAIRSVQDADAQVVSLSPHDSSEWSLARFKAAFGERYVDLKVGQELKLTRPEHPE
jgi:7,8-dihydropterin-6-yl-methyl-4-(beta-D-ribofuranosyl)aminobenzene 5'-phosphate synthase